MKAAPITCESDYDPNSLPVAIAYQKIFEHVTCSTKTESVALIKAHHRVLGKDLLSPMHVPNHNNSAMDGYAITFEDITSTTSSFTMVGKSLAGHPFNGQIDSGQCVRITTGAIMPASCDTVIIQEHVEIHEDNGTTNITILDETLLKQKQGQHVRFAGESLKKNDVALQKGVKLSASEIGLLASLGFSEVEVMVKPKVAIITTGDEIRPVGSDISIGEVYDSNRYTLMAMLDDLGCEIIDLGIISDDEITTKTVLTHAANIADIVIATGGASVGEADYVRNVFKALGDVSFWKLAMRPGRPLSFGRLNNALFFGLPGNPVSVMVTFYQFVKPAVKYWLGQEVKQNNPTGHHRFAVPCASTLKKRPGRIEYQRGILFRDNNNQLQVKATGDQGSGILSSMTQANCFIVLDNDCTGITQGDNVDVEPFLGVY